MTQHKPDKPQVSEDISFEKMEWIVERTGWTVIILLLIASIAGLTGPGPVSKAEYRGNYLTIDYNRYERRQSPGKIKISYNQPLYQTAGLTLRIGREFVDNVEIKRIDPEPERTSLMGAAYVYEFSAHNSPAGSGISILYEAESAGDMKFNISVPGKEQVQLSQFIFP